MLLWLTHKIIPFRHSTAISGVPPVIDFSTQYTSSRFQACSVLCWGLIISPSYNIKKNVNVKSFL